MTHNIPNMNGAIIVLSSHVVRGTVGNRAAAFALEALGHPVWVVPTITLPWHPGHTQKAGPGTRIIPSETAFAAMIEDLANAPWLGEVRGVLSGYLGHEKQADSIANLVRAVKAKVPDAIYALDPVMGDGDALYVPEIQAHSIRETLLPLADLITPNAFELGFLTGRKTPQNETEILSAARSTNTTRILATSSAAGEGRIGNMLVGANHATLAHTPRFPKAPNGAGDLTAALMLAGLIDGLSDLEALQKTTASVFELLSKTLGADADELMLERHQASLREPRESIELKTLF